MIYQALSRTQMAPADALSCHNGMDTSLDNRGVQPLPLDAFNQHIQAVDVTLADKIKESSSNDLLVFQTVHQIKKELPLFNRFKVKDWTFDNSHLYYKIHLYVLEIACHDLISTTHCSFEGSHGDHL